MGESAPLQFQAANGDAVQLKFTSVNSAARALDQRTSASASGKASAAAPSNSSQLGKQQKVLSEAAAPQCKRPVQFGSVLQCLRRFFNQHCERFKVGCAFSEACKPSNGITQTEELSQGSGNWCSSLSQPPS
eukprot:Skav203720  [mRNA]  locus=scaffold259:603798:604193:- [translate_table: standard]